MQIEIPELSLVLLIGIAGSGKSTFATKHFKTTEVLSSDYCRALISDDENNQLIHKETFELLHFIARKRLALGRLTVIDATNVQPRARQPLLALAREYHVQSVALLFNLPEALCRKRNQQRVRTVETSIIHQQSLDLKRSLSIVRHESFRHIFSFNTPKEIEACKIIKVPLRNNLKHERGPFDIIGDIHGCFDELSELLEKLGYIIDSTHSTITHPANRKVIFLGDLVDRGPKIPEVLRLVMNMVATGIAFCVPGNHDMKLRQRLKGKSVKLTYGLAESVRQLEQVPATFQQQILEFLDSLVSHYLLDDGQLVVAHAGMNEQLQGRTSGRVRSFAIYGDVRGEMDEFGLPVRYNWAADYQGQAMVVYGHTPTLEATWLNNTICIDTGCVFGGQLTALRYPEKELVSVTAKQTYCKYVKPLWRKHHKI